MQKRERIRFGIICDSEDLLAWQRTTVQGLISANDIDLKLVIINQNETAYKATKISSDWLWKLFYKLRIVSKSTLLQTVPTSDLFKDIILEKADFIETENLSAELPKNSIELLKNEQLDFVISFSALSIVGEVMTVPKHGLWNFEFGMPEKYRKGWPCFWEIYCGVNVTSAYLQRSTTYSNRSEILHEGHLKTAVSYRKNLDKMLNECCTWPLKVCEDIRNQQTGFTRLSAATRVGHLKKSPSNLQTLIFPFIQLKLRIKQVWKQLFFTDYWNIGIVHSPIQDFLNSSKQQEVNWFPIESKNRFLADPFGMVYNNELHIIYEDLKFEEGIGKTARLVYEQNEFADNELVIEEPFHMSYPFLFQKNGEIYCIPETYQANRVGLYKATDFPHKWNFQKVLIDNYSGIDSTLFRHEETWYLFSTDKNSGPHYNLNIHYASDCFGPWEVHPKNPIKTDIRSARPAGTIFEHEGAIYRPSMDYSEKIEGRISINKIEILSRVDFKEVVHQQIQPFENCYFSDKVHTLSKVGDYTLVDGAKELFIFSNLNAFKYKLKRVLSRLFSK